MKRRPATDLPPLRLAPDELRTARNALEALLSGRRVMGLPPVSRARSKAATERMRATRGQARERGLMARVVVLLAETGPLRVGEIAERMGVSTNNANNRLRRDKARPDPWVWSDGRQGRPGEPGRQGVWGLTELGADAAERLGHEPR